MTQQKLALLVLVLVACTVDSTDTRVNPTTSSPPLTTAAPTTTARACGAEPSESIFTSTDPVKLSLALAGATLLCAEEVVVASGSPQALRIAGLYAAAREAPLLIMESPSDLDAELRRLAPGAVSVIGNLLPNGIPPGTETTSLTVAEAAAELVTSGPVRSSETVWLADATRPDLAAPVVAVAAMRGERVLTADPATLLGNPDLLRELRARGDTTLYVAGGFDPTTIEWEAATLATAPELPGGGFTFFPGRRLVALYGNPTTSALGVLGEQGPEEAAVRAAEIAAGYDADGVPLLLSFEIIATVASAFAGEDNNYSEEMGLEVLHPWIEVAAARGMYVILDLQPGRTDFLTQAKRYEVLLALPHVGLALDPEWRLQPDQVHLRQIGSVDAAEVNLVSEWLAELVRAHNLPQKFFLLHQFRLDMIGNREQVVMRPELATVIQMDGQGPLSTKYDTWAALTAGGQNFFWGWKNFYDEDTPRGGATPAEVLSLTPVPVYISYQ